MQMLSCFGAGAVGWGVVLLVYECFVEVDVIKVVLITHVTHMGENTRTYINFRFIVIKSVNISISVLRYVTRCG
jgi:hypothetical protein